MQTVENVAGHRRIWLRLSRADGSTLELGPGETAEVELPDGFDDSHLRIKKARGKGAKSDVAKDAPVATAEPGDEATPPPPDDTASTEEPQ